jgi:glycosyltransferase involved in cell wall biosynthesis
VYVYDNGSTDATAKVAADAGAVVRSESRPGKGNVVARMLADIDADVYVMVDGDDTYDPSVAPLMVDMLLDGQLDLVTAVRRSDAEAAAYRRGHILGNRLFTFLHKRLFGQGCTDVFSGYRVLSRRFAKTFPATATGFEIEAEMTAHALDIGAPMGEVPCRYTERMAGSESKLRTYRDGLRIFLRSMLYFKEMKPFRFFAGVSVALTIAALALGIPVVLDFRRTGQVLRLPSAVLSVGIEVLAFLCLTCGVILNSLSHSRRETKRLAYLALGPPFDAADGPFLQARTDANCQ